MKSSLKYIVVGPLYDLLDYPWERWRAPMRKELLRPVRGKVLELGVGTGRNLPHYHPSVQVTGIDTSGAMLKRAARRANRAPCGVALCRDDVAQLRTQPDATFNWAVATFVCCVLLDEALPRTLSQVARVLKQGGRFRFLEMGYADNPQRRRRQKRGAALARALYRVRLERATAAVLARTEGLRITAVRRLDADGIYRLIEGVRTR